MTNALRRSIAPRLVALAVLAMAALVAAPAQAKTVKVTGNATLSLNDAAKAALASDGITLTPIAPATAGSDGSLNFPVVRGRVHVKTLRGYAVTKGGVTFTKGAKSAQVRHLVVTRTRRGTTVSALVRVHVRRAIVRYLRHHGQHRRAVRHFRVVARIVSIPVLRVHNVKRTTAGDGTVTATGDATLTAVAARHLDRKLDTKVFKGGAQVGTVTITGSAK